VRLHEYQAKRILRRCGVSVPRGDVASSVDEVRQIAEQLGKRVVLKAQVLTGGRGRAGGIRLANHAVEAERLAGEMFGMTVQGFVASKVLVDEAIEIEQEIYTGIMLAPVAGRGQPPSRVVQPVIVASARGGIELSRVTQDTPDRVVRIPISPLPGLQRYQVRELASAIGLNREATDRFVDVAMGLWKAFKTCDAVLVEANPLVLCPTGEMISLNSKMLIDDHALYRQRELSEMRDESQETGPERLARRHGIHYVRLGGHVGCLSNGAGLAMATMDLLRQHGIKAANFVDIGIGAPTSRVLVGVRLALTNSIDTVLFNVFGGVTRCDEIARGIIAAFPNIPSQVPVVARLEGTNSAQGRQLLRAAAADKRRQVYVVDSMQDAVEKVAQLASERQPEEAAK